MKFKYFLRGLGTGIIFASLICVVAFQTSGSGKISDKEVIERAKKLGMVEKQESVKDMFGTSTSEKKKDKESLKTEVSATEATTTEVTTIEVSATEESMTEESTEQKPEANTTEKSVEETTEKVTEEESTSKTVTITIKGGMTSHPVCEQLQELGVIENATDFDSYLIENGYANRISVGTHTLTIGMTYEEIAIAISDPR